jgi:tRNA U34 5-carboxymethylaminomethyl modifying GTPase MnmE/TrmE
VFDAGCPDDARAAVPWSGPDTILVANKIDLLASGGEETAFAQLPRTVIPGPDPGVHSETPILQRVHGRDKLAHDESGTTGKALPISALTGEGIEDLLSVLGQRVAEGYRIEATFLTRARHRQALDAASLALRRGLGASLAELRAEDLRLALRSLGRITGTIDVEDLLDVIFRDFCIGK